MKQVRYFAINGLFAFFIYRGLYLNESGFLNIAVFMGWLTAISSFFLMNDEVLKTEKLQDSMINPSVPVWLDISFDLLITGTFIYYGYTWLPLFYFIHICNISNARDKVKKMVEEN